MLKTAQKGFTLIELLIVIAIIGVLAAVVLIAVNPARRMAQARDTGRKNDIAQIATALEAYYTSNVGYPPNNSSGGPAICSNSGGVTLLTQTQDLKRVPLDPTGASYCYSVVGSGSNSEASVYITLEAPTGATGFWCWRSQLGRATEVQAPSGCAP